jgi:uncharacterized Zn-finger protein
MGFLRMKLARFMYGRYGVDALYNALFLWEVIFLFAATILSLLGRVSTVCMIISWILYAIALGLLTFAVFRCMSRNIPARRRENERYLALKARLRLGKKTTSGQKKTSFMDTAQHIFRQCPYCKSTLRLPREKGKHSVKCPRCSKSFTVKVRK